MTKARTAVLEILDAAAEPLSAADVALRGDATFDQATLYRALHYLEDEGFAESFVLHCREHGVERYYSSCASQHRHWFHCESCHRFIDLGACKIGGIVSGFENELGIRVTRHTLYLTGVCKSCR